LEEAGANPGLEVATDSLDNTLTAVEYVTKVGTDVGGADRITEVLTTIRESKVTLVKYSGGQLTDSITALNRSAHTMYSGMQKMKSMAMRLKSKAENIKGWMESFEELSRKKITEEHRMTWKVILKDWQVTLKVARENTEMVRDEFKLAVETVLDMRSTIEGMTATTLLKSQEELEASRIRLEEAEAELQGMGSCKWWQALISFGETCRKIARKKRELIRIRDRIKKEDKQVRETIPPLVAKINSIEEVADALLRVGYSKLQAIENFLVALQNAEEYFNNGGRLFSKFARRQHVK